MGLANRTGQNSIMGGRPNPFLTEEPIMDNCRTSIDQ